MDRHGKTVAFIIAILVALYLWWKRSGASVSTSVAGTPVSGCAKTLSACNAGDFGFTSTPTGSATAAIPLGTDSPTIVDPTSYANSPFPIATNTLDTGGLGTPEQLSIAQQSFQV
jgi:hypothetical protein